MTAEVVAAQSNPDEPQVFTIHTMNGPTMEPMASFMANPVYAAVFDFLMSKKPSTRKSYADHFGVPFRVVPTSTQPAGTPRDVSALRGGQAFLLWCERKGLNPLTEVTRQHIQWWVEDIKAAVDAKGKPLDTITGGQMVSAVSSFYDWAMRHGPAGARDVVTYAQHNPVVLDRTELELWTKTAQSPTRSLTQDEAAALQLAADRDQPRNVDQHRTGTLVAVLFELGLRVDEIVTLKREDLSIMQGEWVLTVTGKGGKRRTLKLTRATAARVQRYLECRDRRRGANLPARRGEVAAGSEPLFASYERHTGKLVPMRAGDIARKLQALAVVAGLEKPEEITPHVARHTWAYLARLAGVPDSDIQFHFGHSDGKTTARYGLHVAHIVNSPVDKVATLLAAALLHTFSASTTAPASPDAAPTTTE